MESTPARKSVPRFANVVFWIGAGVFIVSVGSNILMGLIESVMKALFLREGQFVLENSALDAGQRISGGIIFFGLWIVGPTSLISLIVHPRWWAKGISLFLFAYALLIIWAMRSS